MTIAAETDHFTAEIQARPAAVRSLAAAGRLPGFSIDQDGATQPRITGEVLDHHRREAARLRQNAIAYVPAWIAARLRRLWAARPATAATLNRSQPASQCC